MGKPSIRSIYRQFEPELYGRMRRGKDDYNIFNLEYAKCYYFNFLYTLAVSVPTWGNIPLEIDKAIMERILINNGSVVFHYDPILGKYLTLVLEEVQQYDTDGRPLLYSATTLFGNIRYRDLNPTNSVIIWDNVTQIPTLANIEFFAGRLANLRLTIDQCVKNLKVPYLIRTTSNNKAAVEGLLSEIYKFKPAVIEDGVVDLECLKVYPLTENIPEALDSSREEFTNTFNEALSSIGIANVSQEESKRERMTEYEVAKTVTGSMIQQESRLKPRLQGAERINKLYPDLDVKVAFKRVITELDGVDDESYDEGGADDGTVHTESE